MCLNPLHSQKWARMLWTYPTVCENIVVLLQAEYPSAPPSTHKPKLTNFSNKEMSLQVYFKVQFIFCI